MPVWASGEEVARVHAHGVLARPLERQRAREVARDEVVAHRGQQRAVRSRGRRAVALEDLTYERRLAGGVDVVRAGRDRSLDRRAPEAHEGPTVATSTSPRSTSAPQDSGRATSATAVSRPPSSAASVARRSALRPASTGRSPRGNQRLGGQPAGVAGRAEDDDAGHGANPMPARARRAARPARSRVHLHLHGLAVARRVHRCAISSSTGTPLPRPRPYILRTTTTCGHRRRSGPSAPA